MNVLLKNLSEWSMTTSGLDWRIPYGLFVIGMGAFGWLTWILVTLRIDRGGARGRANPSVTPAARRLSDR